MFRLTKEFRFEAAHKLPYHDGKCARLHGHSWILKVHVDGERLITDGPKTGMLMDYAEISKLVKPLVEDKLDHHYLNDTTGLESPTSEKLAVWVYQELRHLPGLAAVEICETCTSACLYTPDPPVSYS